MVPHRHAETEKLGDNSGKKEITFNKSIATVHIVDIRFNSYIILYGLKVQISCLYGRHQV